MQEEVFVTFVLLNYGVTVAIITMFVFFVRGIILFSYFLLIT